MKDKGWMYHEDIAASAAIVFSDLSPEEGQAWVKKFVQHSGISFVGELTHAGYKDIPVAFLVCEKDLCIPAELQREMIENIEKVSGRKVDVTSIETDHVPITTKPELVSDWILDFAGKV
jgi:pimeloyl-ACP methyl ester carboxylesterase